MSTVQQFQRFSERSANLVPSGVLHEGVPPHLKGSLIDWLEMNLSGSTFPDFEYPNYQRNWLNLLDRRFMKATGEVKDDRVRSQGWQHAFNTVPDVLLDAVDLVLQHPEYSFFDPGVAAAEVDAFLREGNSAFSVLLDGKPPMLVRRIPLESQAQVDCALMTNDRASDHLLQAYKSVYARDPRPSMAYSQSIKAVEAAAKPFISPNNSKATLGTMIGEMKSNPSLFESVLRPKSGDAVSPLAGTMSLIWNSQVDRHGTDDETQPPSVSLEEAQAAFHIAVALIHLFRTGAISRIPKA